MGAPVGRRRWVVADAYGPEWSHGPKPQMESHESISLLNTGGEEAHVAFRVFYSDRDPVGPYEVTVPPQRTKHVRLTDLDDPEPIPRGTDYAVLVESDVPVVAQYTRLDSRQAENALVSTMAYPAD